MKLALITGHLGFIGSHLKAELDKQGWRTTGVDIKEGNDICTYNFQGDYNVIFHLAAKASIPYSWDNPAESNRNNVYGSLRVLDFAKRIGAKVVFSSSSSVYGEPKMRPTSEQAAIRYMSPYAFQKYEVEEYIRLLGIKAVMLRYFNVFGEGQEHANGGDSSLVLATFLKQKADGVPLTIVGDGYQKRDFVYVGDVVAANILAATSETTGVINIGSGVNYSVNDIADFIDPDMTRNYLPARPEPKIGLANINKAKRLLNWEPKVKVEDWLKSL